jgi:hypothetical protein
MYIRIVYVVALTLATFPNEHYWPLSLTRFLRAVDDILQRCLDAFIATVISRSEPAQAGVIDIDWDFLHVAAIHDGRVLRYHLRRLTLFNGE